MQVHRRGLDSEYSFAVRLERFMNDQCPECGSSQTPQNTIWWPYCRKCYERDKLVQRFTHE